MTLQEWFYLTGIIAFVLYVFDNIAGFVNLVVFGGPVVAKAVNDALEKQKNKDNDK